MNARVDSHATRRLPCLVCTAFPGLVQPTDCGVGDERHRAAPAMRADDIRQVGKRTATYVDRIPAERMTNEDRFHAYHVTSPVPAR